MPARPYKYRLPTRGEMLSFVHRIASTIRRPFGRRSAPMPSTPSVASGSRSVASTSFKARLLSSKPAIDIFIPDTKPFYSPLDTIAGSVTITVRQPTPFSDISINLVGVTQCSVDNPNASGGHSSSDAMHRFLAVAQPIPEESLPLPMVLQPGQTYTFPFSFVVPAQMLPRACSHAVNSQP